MEESARGDCEWKLDCEERRVGQGCCWEHSRWGSDPDFAHQGVDGDQGVVGQSVCIRRFNGCDLVSLPPTLLYAVDDRFVRTVGGAYFIIGITGFCWAMAQCKYLLPRRIRDPNDQGRHTPCLVN